MSMETFALAAISLTIAASLLIKKIRPSPHITFAALCIGIFIEKTGAFFAGVFTTNFWSIIHALGLLVISPLLVTFVGIFLEKREMATRWSLYTGLLGIVIASVYFPLLLQWRYAECVLYLYIGITLLYCFVELLKCIKNTEGIEKKRFTYVATACAIMGLLSITDIAHISFPWISPMSDISLGALIYFILIIITYPRLPEFYEIMVRTAIVFLLIVFTVVIFYIVLGIFGGQETPPPFNLIFMTAFIVVIFVDPVKLILKKAGMYFFPEGKGSLNSLYTIDEEVEKEKSLLLEEMASTLAHEIRNPLGSIKAAAQYLKSDTDSEENHALFDVITSEIDRLNNVVSRFLNYAKPGAIKPSTKNISDILKPIVALMRSKKLPEEILIREDIPKDLPPVWVDGEQMVQAVLNIALNGVEAMPKGGTLTISARIVDAKSSPQIEIAIQDTGEGIEKKVIERIFKPFYTTKDKGTGIGLAISQQIVKAHGGTIAVTSSPGRGSAFRIKIPIAGPPGDSKNPKQ